jgi:hypothetical protein
MIGPRNWPFLGKPNTRITSRKVTLSISRRSLVSRNRQSLIHVQAEQSVGVSWRMPPWLVCISANLLMIGSDRRDFSGRSQVMPSFSGIITSAEPFAATD